MEYLKITSTKEQLMNVLNKNVGLNLGVCTFTEDKDIHYLALNISVDQFDKLITDFAKKSVGIEVISEEDLHKLSPLYSKPSMSKGCSFIGEPNLFPFGINYVTSR